MHGCCPEERKQLWGCCSSWEDGDLWPERELGSRQRGETLESSSQMSRPQGDAGHSQSRLHVEQGEEEEWTRRRALAGAGGGVQASLELGATLLQEQVSPRRQRSPGAAL